MKTPMKMLDMNAPDFAEQLGAALGLEHGEKVTFVTPQFTRNDGVVVSYIPKTVEEFDLLRMLRPDNLLKLGLRKWSGDRMQTHWLYPSEWYSSIPAGLEIVDIKGEKETFVPGETDDDIRYGMLSFGFIQNHFVD